MKRLFVVLLLLTLPALAGLISTSQEVDIGRRASRQFEQKYGLVRDIGMQERVNRIGQRVAAQADRQDVQYSFKVAEMEQFNALAFPGGFIYTTRGLIKALSDEELAFVLGHEVAHVSRRHSVNQLEKQIYAQTGMAVFIGVLSDGRIDQSAATAAKLANAVMSSRWSQADENDADAVGIKMMAKAGYDPIFAISALEKLSRQAGGTPGFLNTLVGTHPLPQDRINNAYTAVPTIPYQTTAAAPVTTAPSRPAPPPVVDKVWQNDLHLTVKDAATGLRASPALMNQARRQALAWQTREGLSFEVPAPASSVQAESILVGQKLPAALANGSYSLYGLAVARNSAGTRLVVVLLRP